MLRVEQARLIRFERMTKRFGDVVAASIVTKRQEFAREVAARAM